MESNKDTIAIGPKGFKTIAIENKVVMTLQQEDAIINQALDLINDVKFKPYFYKTLKIIGPTAFYEAMDWARKTSADCRPCMFVKRLKEVRAHVESQHNS